MALATLVSLSATLRAQDAVPTVPTEPVPPPERVIHLWVDPMYGNDSADPLAPGAAARNPNGGPACGGAPILPNDVVDPTQGSAVLLHAPWPFQTITGAVNYLVAQSPNVPPLPYASPTTGVIAEHAIIHLMPGRYARSGAPSFENGLSGNGETFPVFLPPNVSIQGTSALNTVLDLEGVGPAFQFGVMAPGEYVANGANTFIDSVTIFGATADEPGAPEASAGIAIGPGASSTPTLSNSFLVRNRVGMIVAGDRDGDVVHDGTLIVNCTFVWNRIGLWNGQLPGLAPAIGTSQLIVVNNIFDAGIENAGSNLPCGQPITWPTFQGFTDFEGLAAEDMTVAGPTGGNFNAFELDASVGGAGARFNQTGPITGGLPGTTPRTMTAVAPTAGRNIAPITGWANPPVQRGVLYVRDALCNGPFQVGNPDWDGSPMDFRLSPGTAPAGNGAPVPPGVGGALNALVDDGFSGPFPMTMANGLVRASAPGFLPLSAGSQSTWPHDCWDHDGEGFGNARIHDHPVYADGVAGVIDIGADEVGEMITAGFRSGTTTFFSLDASFPANVPIMDNRYLFYFGPPAALAGPTPFPLLPYHRRYPIPGGPPAGYTGNYDISGGGLSAPLAAWTFTPTSAYYSPTMADVTPHLLPDVHPYWMFTALGVPCFPVWQVCFGSGLYNLLLYSDPAVGVANPTGTYFGIVPPAGFQWLDEFALIPPVVIDPFGTFGSTDMQAAITFDVWGAGTDAFGNNQTTLPPTFVVNPLSAIAVAVRASLETLPFSTWSATAAERNLQSFAIVVSDGATD